MSIPTSKIQDTTIDFKKEGTLKILTTTKKNLKKKGKKDKSIGTSLKRVEYGLKLSL